MPNPTLTQLQRTWDRLWAAFVQGQPKTVLH
jgi:hypothetical protein